jgi:hypothetical protein
MRQRGHTAAYEPYGIRYVRPAEAASYRPDWVLENGIIVEAKGRFTSKDRKKHKAIKLCHPDLDIRFVFARPSNKLGTKSKTTYAAWCAANGFEWAEKTIPEEWFHEPPLTTRMEALERARKPV